MRIVRRLILIVVLLLLAPYALTPLYSVGHPVSALMAWRVVTGSPVERSWMDLAAMSPALPRSVVASEDARFCTHNGIDWSSLQNAIEDAQDGEVSGGGSTITQQVAKNLFLWPGRSVLRKGLEIPLAMWIDLVLTKARILEIYLNIAEMGPSGQFGAESAANSPLAARPPTCRRAMPPCWRRCCPIRLRAAPKRRGPGVRRLAATYMARAQAAELQRCWAPTSLSFGAGQEARDHGVRGG